MPRTPWKSLESTELFRNPIFRLRHDRLELPDGRVMPRYFVIEFPDWVNVIPVTRDRQIVLVEQYRHATGQYTIEIPGGSTDPRAHETTAQAAARELAEETGYTSPRLEFLAKQAPNPALQSNYTHTFVAWDCALTQEPTPDPFEDIRVFSKSIAETYAMIRRGEIDHSIIVAALLYALPLFGVDFDGLR